MDWPRLSPFAPLDVLREASPRPHAFRADSPDAARAWRRGFAPVLARLLTLDRMAPVDLAPRVLATEDCGAYTVTQIRYASEPGVEIPAALLVPKGLAGPAPALLCPPGHGRGVTDQLDSDPEGHAGVQALNYDYSRQFAERGYVVLTPEIRGFGSLEDPELRKRSFVGNCDALFTHELMMGRCLAGIRVWDLLRGLDYLAGRPEVDPERIGCAGLSMGGELAMLVSAVDERIRCAMVSGFLCTYHGLMMEKQNCRCYLIPGIWQHADMPEIAGLVAPRPLVVETGTQDGCFPWPAVNEAYATVERIYAAWGASDRLVRDIHPAGHRFSGAVAFDWFDRWLKG